MTSIFTCFICSVVHQMLQSKNLHIMEFVLNDTASLVNLLEFF
jgi:hypothetical protein